ncbi:glutamine synthetase [Streptomyces sp. DvalAA-14]|uniref:glutamine synthetase family protein n=1 Tax=unclassified Streptomyces TaxID=2593676 RepID=UPI00081BB42A|nr:MULTISPECIES: glutamine synthetase family protein [unclassified Streptomyces]MYS23766.1 glutamine synthetase [Streptomyces sp. SID4948]SCE38436.1 glutamine synthetase [Streptomyces sp. DvalAA-14]
MDEERSAQAHLMRAQLAAEGVVGLALSWVDNAGITRTKGVPLRRLEDVVRDGVGMSPVFDAFLVDDSATTGPGLGGPDGDLRLFPDLERAVPLAAQPGWAWAPADRYAQDGTAHPACQRLFARRMTERARARGLSLLAAYEVEWIMRRPDGTDPAEGGPAYGLHRLTDLSDYLRDLLRALEAQGLDVQQIHPEYAAGQFEVSVAAQEPVAAADSTVLVRQTIRGVSARHGLRASFAPCFEPGAVGNGAHLHLSAWRDGSNLMTGGAGPYQLTATGESLLAGILDALPALLVLGAPGPASHLRLVPSQWAGAYQCWGPENREAALRLISGRSANAEVKCFDGAANPYLALGGTIAAALAGLDAAATLPAEVNGDPARLSSPPPRLPESAADALSAFTSSATLREALGEPLHQAVRAVRQAEIELFADRTPTQIAEATRWRY